MFSLAPLVGDGTEASPFRPDVAGSYSLIDLRADATQAPGWCLLTADSVPSSAVDLGETLVENMPRGISRNLESLLGVTLDQTSNLRAIIAELLILWGDDRPRGVRTRWRPIKSDHRGMNRIVLGGELVFEAPVVEGATFTDDFNRADEDLSLSANWNADPGHNWAVLSNQLKGTDASEAMFVPELDSDNHYAQVVHQDDTMRMQLGVRNSDTADLDDMYLGSSDPTQAQIFKRIAGSFSTLATQASTRPSAPVLFRTEVDGSSVEVFWGVASITSTTDTDITTGRFTGIRTSGSGDSPLVDDFEAGDLVSGVSHERTISSVGVASLVDA